MVTKRFLLILTAIVLLGSMLAACGPAAEAEPTTVSGTTEETTVEDPAAEVVEGVPAEKPTLVRPLVLAWYATPPSIDGDMAGGLAQAAAVNTCESLLAYKRVLNEYDTYEAQVTANKWEDFDPRLAESMTVSEDGTVWTFKLREGVLSNYGNELTSADVVWSYERAFRTKGIAAFVAQIALQLAGPESVRAIDKYTVEFTTTRMNPIFLNGLTIYTPCIHDSTELKKHVTTEDPYGLLWTSLNNATFGAWQLVELTAGSQAVFEPNPNYYRGMPYFSKVIWREVPVSANRMALLQSGDTDIAFRLTNREKSEISKDESLKVPQGIGNLTHQWRLNFAVEPFDDVRVRQAMAYAVPYEEILSKVYYGFAEPMKSFLPPWSDGYDDSAWVYTEDLEKAKALLVEAGYPDGFETTVTLSTNFQEFEEAAVLIKENLAKIGVTLNIDKNPESKFNENRYSRKFPSTLDYDQPQIPIGIYSFPLVFATTSTSSNFNNYSNAEVDALIDKAWAEPSPEKRAEIYKEIQALLAEDVAWVYLAIPSIADATKASINGYSWYPDNQLRWFDLSEE